VNSATLKLTLAFSLAFNIAFIGVAVFRTAAPEPPVVANQPETDDSPLASLDLSDQQQAELTAEKQQTEARIADILQDSREQRDALIELLKADEPDRDAIHNIQKRLGENQCKIREISVDHLMHVTSMLEPEQRQKFLTAMRHSSDKHRRRRHAPQPYTGAPANAARTRKLLGADNVVLTPRRIPGGMEISIQSFDPETAEKIKAMVPDYFRSIKNPKGAKPAHEPKKETRNNPSGGRDKLPDTVHP